ncbi:hypothetical protein KAR91_57740 [Candidatus Pacearchaeota archaeon]|nr:hypothetical protein [Candidatus Pacearchaeota archaeon]
MADYVDYTGKQFGTYVVERLANVTDICRRQDRSRKITEWIEYDTHKECVFVGRHKYWYCVCIICGVVDIVRSDHLSEKTCKCQK